MNLSTFVALQEKKNTRFRQIPKKMIVLTLAKLHRFCSKVTWVSDCVSLPPAAQTDAACTGSSPWPHEPFQSERSGVQLRVKRPKWKSSWHLLACLHHHNYHWADNVASLKMIVSPYIRILRLTRFQFFPKSIKAVEMRDNFILRAIYTVL